MNQEESPQPEQRGESLDRSSLKEAWDIKHLVNSVQDDFLQGALTKGAAEGDLPKLVAEAMTTGQLPRIVVGMSMRSGMTSYTLLDGVVSPDALRVEIYRNPSVPGYMRASVKMNHEVTPNQDDAYSLSQVMVPGQNTVTPFDAGILEALRAHIEPPTSETSY